MQIMKNKTSNVFEKHFGEKSLDQAKKLLAEALETCDDYEIKAEIKRRQKLLQQTTKTKF